MIRNFLTCIAFIFLAIPKIVAQDTYTDQINKYIEKYYPLAIEEQKRVGIPAAITIAQGIHETDAGNSELMTKANNHFGIKCKSDWKGETFIHTDNAPDECFKKYPSAEDSYKDHSDHLKKNPRYAPLFSLSLTDYAGWAIGLKTAGYATNPQYSVKLIKIIEDYHLQQYTYMAISGPEAKNYPAPETTAIVVKKPVRTKPNDAEKTDSLRKVVDSLRIVMTTKQNQANKSAANESTLKKIADSARNVVMQKAPEKKEADGFDSKYDSNKVFVVNGLKAFYAYKDEMLLKYAVKYKMRYPRLLELNDLPDAPLQANMVIYLEKKLSEGAHAKHTVKEGENMQLIAQIEGMQLKRLAELNMLEANEEPIPGTILELQTPADKKPVILATRKKSAPKADDKSKKQADNDFVAVPHPKKAVLDTPKKEIGEDIKIEPIAEKIVKRQPALLKEDSSAEDLTGLKAELDRVVYVDNSKLKQTQQKAKPAPQRDLQRIDPDNDGEQVPVAKVVKKEPVKKEPVKKAKTKTYKIKKGDTLSGIADKFDVSIKELRKWNNIKGNNIRDGVTIRVE